MGFNRMRSCVACRIPRSGNMMVFRLGDLSSSLGLCRDKGLSDEVGTDCQAVRVLQDCCLTNAARSAIGPYLLSPTLSGC